MRVALRERFALMVLEATAAGGPVDLIRLAIAADMGEPVSRATFDRTFRDQVEAGRQRRNAAVMAILTRHIHGTCTDAAALAAFEGDSPQFSPPRKARKKRRSPEPVTDGLSPFDFDGISRLLDRR